MTKSKKINVKGTDIVIFQQKEDDFISLTDIARYKNSEEPRFAIQNWIKTRYTVDFLGIWEQLHNSNFNRVEFDTVKNEAGTKVHTDAINQHLVPSKISSRQEINIIFANEADVLNKALFGMTAKEWQNNNPKLEGNMRDYADVIQLVCLANLETLNAEFIRQGINQGERLLKLNEIAIIQIQSLTGNPSIKKLK